MLEDFFCFVIRFVLICIGLSVIGYVFIFILLSGVIKWNYVKDLTLEQKKAYAQMVMLPEIADSIERYGTNGFQDVYGKIETQTFSNLDALCEGMSKDMQKTIRSTIEKNVDGNFPKKATYVISSDDLPPEIREANEQNYYEIHYFINRNWNGSYSLEIQYPLKFFNHNSIKEQ